MREAQDKLAPLRDEALLAEHAPADVAAMVERMNDLVHEHVQGAKLIYYDYHRDRSGRGARRIMREHGVTRAQLDRIEAWAEAQGIPAAIDARAKEVAAATEAHEDERFRGRCGDPPTHSDGIVLGARGAIRRQLHDPESLSDLRCGPPLKTGGQCWRSGCRFRAKNRLGAVVQQRAAVFFEGGEPTRVAFAE